MRRVRRVRGGVDDARRWAVKGRPAVLLQQLAEQLHEASETDAALEAFDGTEEEALLLALTCVLGAMGGLTEDTAALRRVVRRWASDSDLWRAMLRQRPAPKGTVS